jgi:hypothetical protein
MFQAFRGPLGDEFLTEQHDPAGMKRALRRELDLFGGVHEPVATYAEAEEISIKVEFNFTEESVLAFRERYRGIFETGELEEMCDIVEDFVEASRAAAEDLEPEDDGEEAFGRYLAQQAIIAASVAVAQSLQQLFREEIGNRLESAAAGGQNEPSDDEESFLGEDDGGWPEPNGDDEAWEIGTVMDPHGEIPVFDGADATQAFEDAEYDERILDAAMDAAVNMAEVAQSFDAIQKYLDEQFHVERIEDTTPAYQKALALLTHRVKDLSGGTITLRLLLSMRHEPSVTAILAPLTRAQATCCFTSVFHNVAEAALYEVSAFSDLIDAKTPGDGAMNQEIDDTVLDYVSELIERNVLD